MKERCDEILKQYGILGCTDFSFPLKSEHPVTPPIHPNPNIVRIFLNPYRILDDPLQGKISAFERSHFKIYF